MGQSQKFLEPLLAGLEARSEHLGVGYRRYSLDYVDKEAGARAARRGVWTTTFERPWEWRRQQRKRQP